MKHRTTRKPTKTIVITFEVMTAQGKVEQTRQVKYKHANGYIVEAFGYDNFFVRTAEVKKVY